MPNSAAICCRSACRCWCSAIPAQLPPIQGGGFFTEAEPDVMLTEVHRQAQDDPIIRLSMDIRAGEYLEPGRYGETEVVRKSDLDPQRVLEADQVLVGRNVTRRSYNARMRERRGFEARCRRPATSWCACATTARRACSTAGYGR